jgi:hypothetical protein
VTRGNGARFTTISRDRDAGQIIRAQRQPYSVHPQHIVLQGDHPFDDTDALAADVCSTIKRHGERFENDDQLRSWLDEDAVRYPSESLAVALRQLEHLGRMQRLRVDQFDPDWSLPGVYVEPRIFTA